MPGPSLFFSYSNFTLITVKMSKCFAVKMFRQTVIKLLITVKCSHSAETVEFRYGFKLLRLALRFHIRDLKQAEHQRDDDSY